MGLFRRRNQQPTRDASDESADFDSIHVSPDTVPQSPRRRGLGRLFSRKKKQLEETQDVQDKSTDGSEAEEMHDDFSTEPRGPPPTFAPHGPSEFRPSIIQSKITEASNESASVTYPSYPRGNTKAVRPATVPPPARQSAFHGPPRFDWIDIEFAAATKIQSIYRRNLVMKTLEEQGLSTSAIRNRKRRRKAVNRSYFTKVQQHGETPSLFGCCSMGLAFGALTDDDDVAYRDYQRHQYEERVQQQQEHEDAIRRKYLQEHGLKEADQILQVMEVHD